MAAWRGVLSGRSAFRFRFAIPSELFVDVNRTLRLSVGFSVALMGFALLSPLSVPIGRSLAQSWSAKRGFVSSPTYHANAIEAVQLLGAYFLVAVAIHCIAEYSLGVAVPSGRMFNTLQALVAFTFGYLISARLTERPAAGAAIAVLGFVVARMLLAKSAKET